MHESLWIKQPCQPPQNIYCRGVVDVVQEAVDEDEVEPAIALAGVSTDVCRQEPAAVSAAGVREIRAR